MGNTDHHNETDPPTAGDSQFELARRWGGMTLAFVGLCISGYLAWLSLTGQVAPGCGSGEGCGEVLGSRWSAIGAVPVSVLAAAGYIVILALLALRPCRQDKRELMLGAMGVALIGAAAWYIALQATLIDAWCTYCLAGHGVGVTLGLVLVLALPLKRMAVPFGLGIPAVMLLIGIQVMVPADSNVLVMPSGEDYDLTDDAGRRLGVIGGQLQFAALDVPHTGPTDGGEVVVIFLDYACPHCREAHAMLAEERINRLDLVVFALPVSLYATHNPHIPVDDDRFEHSYELALLSMAVWRDAPEDWPAFDDWLFGGAGSMDAGPQWPRPLLEAERYAGELIGEDKITSLYESPELVGQYQRNLDALYGTLEMSSDEIPGLPIAIAPFATRAVYGRFDEARLLNELLEDAALHRP